MHGRRPRTTTTAGVAWIALATFAAALAAEHLLQPGLSPLTHQMSEYATGPDGALATAAFVAWSLSLAATGRIALRAKSSRVLAILLALAAIGMATVACFETQTVAGVVPAGGAVTVTGRLTISICILGLFFFMAATSPDAGTERLAWLGAAGLVGAVFYRYQNGALTALWWGLRAPRHVGDIVTLDDGTLAYIVDLAVQGTNYMRINDDRSYSGAKFPHKKDDDIPLELVRRLKPHNPPGSTALGAPCRNSSDDCSPQADWCSGVNWYCRCNPDAHQ